MVGFSVGLADVPSTLKDLTKRITHIVTFRSIELDSTGAL